MILDTNDQNLIAKFEEKKEELNYNLEIKGVYDTTDFALVRTTNFIEDNHIVAPLNQLPFVTQINTIAHSTMFEILKDKYNITDIDIINKTEKYIEFQKIVNKYTPLSTQYRSTIHFTLNGLVSNHGNNEFDGQNFIIIDKLDNYLGKQNIRSIRMEDTFIKGTVEFSDKAIILINQEKYEKLINKFPYLNKYNIVLFKGDETLATEIILAQIGIHPEKINTNSAKYTERTSLYQKHISDIAEKYNITENKHSFSPEYTEDNIKSAHLWEIYNIDFYNKLFDHLLYPQNKKEEIIKNLTINYDPTKQTELLKFIINEIGLEKYQNFVINYNQQIYNSIEQGIYPTNDEILEKGYIELKNNNKKL